MKESDFKTGISGLKIGKHAFDWKVDASFFEELNPDLLEDADLKVGLILKKSETMIEADISITGSVVLACDRSLKLFSEELSIDETVYFKYGEEPQELSENIQIIHFNEESIDFSQLIYELVSISIPMKRLHPDYREEDEDDYWVYVVDDEDESEEQSSESIDPRWAALQQLTSNSKNKDDQKS